MLISYSLKNFKHVLCLQMLNAKSLTNILVKVDILEYLFLL